MERKNTNSAPSPNGAIGGARKKTKNYSDATQLSGSATRLQQQLQAVEEQFSLVQNSMSRDYDLTRVRRQPVLSPAPAPAPSPLDSPQNSHIHGEMLKILNKAVDAIDYQGKRISNLEGALMSMFKCLQNLESQISQQQLAGPSSSSVSSGPIGQTPSLQHSPQTQPPSADTQQRSDAPQDPALGPGQARAGRDTSRLGQSEQTQSWKMRKEEDSYYLRTVEVRGFLSETYNRMTNDPTNSPYHWAKKILNLDATEGILCGCRMVKFFPPQEGRGPSFRMTYDSIGEMRRALVRVGGARNELRMKQSDLHLSYYQLTPPRFHKTKTALYKLISSERKRGRVKNFYFLVVRNKLCSLIKVPRSEPDPPRRDGRPQRNTGRRFETRLVTLSGDSYDDLIKIQNEEDYLNSEAPPVSNRIPDNEEADLQMNESYEEEYFDTGSENNMIIDNEEADIEEILYSDSDSEVDMSGCYEL